MTSAGNRPAPGDRQYAIGLLLVGLTMFSASSIPVLIKVGLAAAVPPVTLVTLRLVTATVASWLVFPLVWPGVWRIDRRGLGWCVAAGVTNGTGQLCYSLALSRVDASIAQMILSLYPLITLILLATRGEALRRRSVISLGLGLVGAYLLIGPGGQVDLVGVLLLLCTATVYSLHLSIVQWYLGDYPAQTVALYAITFMAAMNVVVRLLQFRPWQPLAPAGWTVVLILGLVCTLLARLALFSGIRRIGSGKTALLGLSELFLSVLLAFVFLGERLSPVQWVGGVLTLVSSALAVRRPRGSLR
jgi:drug/metabolite transporter (DMT)-like permease